MKHMAVVWMVLAALAAPVAAQTLSTDAGVVLVGHPLEIPLRLNSAPAGIQGYEITVQFSDGRPLDVDAVYFPPALSESGRVQIAPDLNSVTISATDLDDQIRAGANNVELARIKVRGTANGSAMLQVAVKRLINDQGVAFTPAIKTSTIQVQGGPSPDQMAVVGGHDSTAAGALMAVPIILSSAPHGLSEYKVTLVVGTSNVADIQSVEFIAFSGSARVDISSDGKTVSFSARDDLDEVGLQAVGVQLARVVLRGVVPGQSELKVTVDRLTNDSGGPAGTAAKNGSLTVLRQENASPAFFQALPSNNTTIQADQPTITIHVEDNDLNANSLVLNVQDSQGSYSFTRQDPGVRWDGTQFSLNLAEADIRLAQGEVQLEMVASDLQGQRGWFRWRICVYDCRAQTPPTGSPSLEAALDTNQNHRLDDAEILQAIQYWISGTPVPGAGRTISDQDILRLIGKWISGESIS